ncbi:MAG: helix-turn-helix domain-containing protein [Desulfurococcales archaeon]|nr:helix-turn-helix domain-containing protein [Desulfurococcales archaeon]
MSTRPRDYALSLVARRIAGDIAMSNEPGATMKKWREYFNASQQEIARYMGVSSSVVSDYEKGRRVPGVRFIQRYVKALLQVDQSRGWPRIQEMTRTMGIPAEAVIDMRDFREALTIEDLLEAVNGVLLAPDYPIDKRVYGYTVVDSIKAIATLSGIQFYALLGGTPERAIVFTGVRMGRSPMVAVRVSPVKPGVVVIHGPREKLDPLAVELAKLDGVPLILSLAETIEDLVKGLRKYSQEEAIFPAAGVV